MALPILDGNQSATTLSTIVTGGQHIPAHTVVSLGSQAITDMRSAVSGSVVSISNFPASQTVAGTVTANVFGYSDNETSYQPIPVVPWDESVSGGRAVVVKVEQTGVGEIPISGTVTANVPFASTTATFPSQIVALGVKDVLNTGNIVPVDNDSGGGLPSFIKNIAVEGNADTVFPIWLEGTSPARDVPISGTVTAYVTNSVTVGAIVGPLGGSVFKGGSGSTDVIRVLPFFSQNGFANYNEISTSNALPVSGTVTANNPSGALTTRFGSVTTANTAQLTSAVTNASRKFLLVQNIATSTVTIGIGFAPTTTQGIQLTAGAGLTFDAFCPTGGVWWLSSTTGSNFSILEG